MNLVQSPFTLDPSTFTVGPVAAPPAPAAQPQSFGGGATLVHFAQMTAATAESALKSLRTCRAGGRRFAWCYPGDYGRTSTAELAAWGRRAVEEGRIHTLIACGPGSRELATAARDAGLAIGRVVVCRDEATARNVLCDCLGPGDLVLALGVDVDNCRRLAERLEWRFTAPLAATA